MPPKSTHISLWWATLPGVFLFVVGAGFEIASAIIHSSMNAGGMVLNIPGIGVGIMGLSTPSRPMLKINWAVAVPSLGAGIFYFAKYMSAMEHGAL